MMMLERYLDLQKYGTMIDTFTREYYDENDKFYKFWLYFNRILTYLYFLNGKFIDNNYLEIKIL